MNAFTSALVAAAAMSHVPSLHAADDPNGELHEHAPRTLLIVHTPPLADAADEWAAYRSSPAGGSWNVETVAFTDQPAEKRDPGSASSANARAHALLSLIREHIPPAVAASASHIRSSDAFMVLLLGDALPESFTGARTNELPTASFGQPDPRLHVNHEGAHESDRYVSDEPLQHLKPADRLPGFPLGRVPASTHDEARIVLRKIMEYEAAITSDDWFAQASAPSERIVYAAGLARMGAYDGLFEPLFRTMLERTVPEHIECTMAWANGESMYCPPPSALTSTLLSQLAAGGVLLNYIGHGHAYGFDVLEWRGQRYRILRAQDLAQMPDQPSRTPLALLTCCSTGWFDLPDDQLSLAEAMLFTRAAPLAVIAASRPSHPYANAVQQTLITRALMGERPRTIGELDLAVDRLLSTERLEGEPRALVQEIDAIAAPIALAGRWPVSLAAYRRMNARMYNLLGDPAMILPPRTPGLTDLALNGSHLTAIAPKCAKATVTVSFCAPRGISGKRGQLVPLSGPDDPDLEAKAARNFPLVNDRVIAQKTFALDGEHIDLDLGPLPDGVAVIRVLVMGHDEGGSPVRFLDSLTLPRPRADQ